MRGRMGRVQEPLVKESQGQAIWRQNLAVTYVRDADYPRCTVDQFLYTQGRGSNPDTQYHAIVRHKRTSSRNGNEEHASCKSKTSLLPLCYV